MPTPEEDRRERAENERELQAARMERKSAEVVEKRLTAMWREFGVDYDTSEGRDEHRDLLHWMRAKKKRGETFNKRLQSTVVMLGAVAAMAGGLVKWVVDLYQSGGFNGRLH